MQLPGGCRPPYSTELAQRAAEDSEFHWDPLAAARLAQFFNEHFGPGTASYEYVAHHMPFDEYTAWWSYFARYTALAKTRKEQTEHDDLMKKAAKAAK